MTWLLKVALYWIVGSLVLASLLAHLWPRRYPKLPDPPRPLDFTRWGRP